MLVSPLMSPILCLTLGTALRDAAMVRRGLRNELWGILICLLVGALVGVLISPFYGPRGVTLGWATGRCVEGFFRLFVCLYVFFLCVALWHCSSVGRQCGIVVVWGIPMLLWEYCGECGVWFRWTEQALGAEKRQGVSRGWCACQTHPTFSSSN
jgi:hypothetical protein